MKKVLVLAAMAVASSSFATVLITFDEAGRSDGEVLGSQYNGPADGVNFLPGLNGHTVPNPAGTGQGFASATSMVLTTSDIGGGVNAPISGRLFHSFGGWLGEDGDPVFTMVFKCLAIRVSADFGGISTAASTVMYGFRAGSLIASQAAGGSGTQNVSIADSVGFDEVVVTIGDYGDWVGMDNLRYECNPVPEPGTLAALGLGAVAMLRRRKK